MIVAIEGINGSGKSTQARLLAEALRERKPDQKVYELTDPGVRKGDNAHIKIRPLARFAEWKNPMTRMMLYMAQRCELFAVIREAIAKETWIVLDRYIPSFYVYGKRAFRSDQDVANLLKMCNAVPADCTIILSVSPNLGIERFMRVSRDHLDVYEKGGLDMMQNLHAEYMNIASFPERYDLVGQRLLVVPITDSDSAADVHKKIMANLEKHFPKELG